MMVNSLRRRSFFFYSPGKQSEESMGFMSVFVGILLGVKLGLR